MNQKFVVSIAISFSFLSLGFALLHFGLIGYGLSFFVFLPFCLGYILGGPHVKKFSYWGLVISLVLFFLLLLFGGLEGMVCILMALPLIIGAILLGVLVKYLMAKFRKKKEPNLLKSSVLPFCIFLFLGVVENSLTSDQKELVEISSVISLPYSTMAVYEAIKSVDTLDAPKPFLMQLDLPVPLKCVLVEEKVGGLRTCYFEGGQIVERITELEPGKSLKMDVIDYQLTGRSWLGFERAIYLFEVAEGNTTKLTRITSYTSNLFPRVYWKPLEKIGIEQEHEYVFRNLVKDLGEEN